MPLQWDKSSCYLCLLFRGNGAYREQFAVCFLHAVNHHSCSCHVISNARCALLCASVQTYGCRPNSPTFYFGTNHFLPAIRSLERKARYLFYFCCFVRFFLSTISRQPAGQFTPNFACGRTLVPNVSSPLLGVGGPRRAEKGANEIFVTMGVNGEFMHFGGFWAISQQRLHESTPNIICVGTMSADVPLPHVVPIGPWGVGRGS